MVRGLLTVLLFLLGSLSSVRAVATGSGYNSTAPTSADIPNWDTGWDADGITGWNYVGQVVHGASAVYLGNGWVLTAAHVGSAEFDLDGNAYAFVPGSAHPISDANGTADLVLYQIATAPDLPPLKLTLGDPAALSSSGLGSPVAILGYGGLYQETWGLDTISFTNQLVTPDSTTYVSNDFLTVTGSFTEDGVTSNNPYYLVGGDSGGGDFIYDAVHQTWVLAGINEAVGSGTLDTDDGPQTVSLSAMVQVNTYATQIAGITGLSIVPEPPAWMLTALALVGLGGFGALRKWRSDPNP